MDIRLDKLLVDRNLAQNRTKAEEIITTYGVLVNGKLFNKIGKKFPSDAEIRLVISDERWSSIHAQKLIEALSKWKINLKNTSWFEIAMDPCAASEVLLSEGAKNSICLIEHNVLIKERFKDQKNLVLLQNTPLRSLSNELIPSLLDGMIIDTLTPLNEVLPFITPFLRPKGIAILIIKPQIELDKSKLNKIGTIAQSKYFPFLKEQCIELALRNQLVLTDYKLSPLLGENGNKEFMGLFFKKDSA
jgi:23S rRNA (cytidine1920-2'-O)/16S rRNA (cytidine1409-2'-O)-methyltransferase